MFIRARKKEEIESRKKEICESLDLLFWEKSLKDISMQEIADNTSISRTSLYSYYKSKEEILLDSMIKHLKEINLSMKDLANKDNLLKVEEMVDELFLLGKKHRITLKILSSSYFDLEKNATFEHYQEFHKLIHEYNEYIHSIYLKYHKDASEEEINRKKFIFASTLYGLYPMTNLTPKQKGAIMNDDNNFEIELEKLGRLIIENFLY